MKCFHKTKQNLLVKQKTSLLFFILVNKVLWNPRTTLRRLVHSSVVEITCFCLERSSLLKLSPKVLDVLKLKLSNLCSIRLRIRCFFLHVQKIESLTRDWIVWRKDLIAWLVLSISFSSFLHKLVDNLTYLIWPNTFTHFCELHMM